MIKRTYIMACPIIYREVKEVLKREKYDRFNLFYVTPGKKVDKILMLLDDLEKSEHIDLIPVCNKHTLKNKIYSNELTIDKLKDCYDLIIPKDLLNYYFKKSALILISSNLDLFLKSNWFKEIIMNCLEQSKMKKIVIFDTSLDNNLSTKAEKISQILEIPYRIIPIGLNFVKLKLEKLLLKEQYKQQKNEFLKKLTQTSKTSATYEMSFELIQELLKVKTEKEVITQVFKIYKSLFSPQKLQFSGLKNGKILYKKSEPSAMDDSKLNTIIPSNLKPKSEIQMLESDGFIITLKYNKEIFGYLSVQEIQFKEYIDRYLNVALAISKICGLAIHNARIYQELMKTIQDLERSNKDLENFAYVVSHDLKQPLTTIIGYINLLEEIQSGKINSDPKKAIIQIKNGSKYMSEMIDDLLTYSRVGNSESEKEKIDLNEIIEEVKRNLHFIIEKNNAKIISENLPNISGNHTQIVQVFQNLIENGIKFRRESDPIIKIKCEKKEDRWEFCISDNGIGVERENFKKIFRIFRRVPSDKNKITGTGIGLSVCKKIIESLGGRIWVESEYGKGSNFYFTIPLQSNP
ncbi:MAG: sensor histidine kinase [Promethearchaeia archaeon]